MAGHQLALIFAVALLQTILLCSSESSHLNNTETATGPEYVEVATPLGKLKGLVKKTFGNKTYCSFQGIPYAQPPVGSLRFKAPQPAAPWEGVRDATKEGNDALQKHILFQYPMGDEDCLYLNVYTPKLGPGARKAVMVWIFGGAFIRGSGSTELYGPDYLLDQDVVIVTFNYRIGALGFLSLEIEKAPGNAGLKDQTMALRWVHDNIATFGGDPYNVTIFGESAGAASVHYHLLSPLSSGLFHKAIMQSGFSLSQWAFQSRPREKAILLAKELGFSSEDPEKVLEFLMSVPAQDLFNAQDNASLTSDKEKLQVLSVTFLPCVEKAGDAPFLTDTPRNLMERGEFSRVPVMMGITDKEMLVMVDMSEEIVDKVNADLSLLVPNDLKVAGGAEEERKIGRAALQFYTANDTISWDNVQGYVDYFSDVEFVVPLTNTRQSLLKHHVNPVYTYLFTYTSPQALSAILLTQKYPDKAAQLVGSGASHGDDIFYQFKPNLTQFPFPTPNGDDRVFMNKILKAWTTFAKTGNPNCPELGVTWSADALDNPFYLDLGKTWRAVQSTVFPTRMEFWENIYGNHSYVY